MKRALAYVTSTTTVSTNPQPWSRTTRAPGIHCPSNSDCLCDKPAISDDT
jgi:hypothetical protein